MDYNLKDISTAHARALFGVGDDVTIKIYDKDDTDVTPAGPDNECSPYGELDTFKWPYTNLVSLPTSSQEYSWIMTNGTEKQRDADLFSAGGATFLQIPFDTNIWEQTVNKGDVWEPEFRVDTNSTGLKVTIELTDMIATFYKATSNVADRGDGNAGGDDQVLLLCEADTFHNFRIYVTDVETKTFDSNYMDITITVETSDGKIQTLRKKVGFTEISAIKVSP